MLDQSLVAFAASRMADQIWAIRPSSMQAHLGAYASGAAQRLPPPSAQAEPSRQGAVAVYRVEGVLVPNAEWRGEVGSFALADALAAGARDESVAGGVLHINSPGGICHGMLEATQAAAEFAAAKPLVAHVAGCCCSAAYNLASQAHEIYAGPRDDIGSIGTRSLIYDFSDYFAELGVKAIKNDTGPIKSIGAMGTEVTAEQQAFLQRRVDYLQQDFRANVERGRGMTPEQFDAIATGEWWFGEQAVGLGLIDGVQSFQQTLAGVTAATSPTSITVPETPAMAAEATTETAGPKPATSKELREKFPKSSAEWREEQTDAGATLEEASIAYGQLMAERLEAAEQERDQAKAEAEQATADTGGGEGPPKSRRGAPSLKAKPADGETATGGEFDYRAMAEKYMADRKCRWSEACLAIKRRHPEARGAFGAPPKRGS